MQLRSYQQDIINQINSSQSKRIIVSAPTGAGKAITLLSLAKQYTIQNKRVLLLVDRLQLVNQLSQLATNLSISHNIITGDKCSIDEQNHLTIASIQSWGGGGCYDLVLIDECHSVYDKTRKYMQENNNTLVVGFTATPFTPVLKVLYDEIICTITQQELTNNGILSDFKLSEYVAIDMTGAKKTHGEYRASEVVERSHKIYGDIVNTLLNDTSLQRNTLVFCASIKHCEDVKHQLTQHGIKSAIYTSAQDKYERPAILDKFINGKIGIIITVATLSKGFDCPQIANILDLRPLCSSFAEYVQMIGRGLRTHKDKQYCRVIDFSGNWQRFSADYMAVRHNGVADYYDEMELDDGAIKLLNQDIQKSLKELRDAIEVLQSREITVRTEDIELIQVKDADINNNQEGGDTETIQENIQTIEPQTTKWQKIITKIKTFIGLI